MSTTGRRRIVSRIRAESVGLRRIATTAASLYPIGAATAAITATAAAGSSPEASGMMETSIMTTADALATGAEMVVVEDVSSSIEHHHHHHQTALMNGITVTLANGGTVTVGEEEEEEEEVVEGDDGDSNNKYDVADKDEHDLGAIDFASAATHNNMEAESTPPPGGGDKMRCYGATADDDNDGTGAAMMIVDSVGATETACSTISNSSNSSNSSSNSSSSSSSSSSGSSSGSARSGTAQRPEPDERVEQEEEEEEDEDEGEEEEEVEEDGQAPAQVAEEPEHGGGVKISVDKLQLQMMQTDDDPLLQETINALMNGAAGIEVVNTSEHDPNDPAASAIASDPNIATVIATSGRSANEEAGETDRNYECTYCGKLFTRSNTLSYHLKVHTGERPFKCKHCAKAFREQYRLMKHLKTHSKYRNRRLEQQQQQGQQGPEQRAMSAPRMRVHLQRGRGATVTAMMAEANGLVATGEEDYTTGDSERFFKSYDLPDGSVAMKLEPDISLTEDADVSEDVGPEAMLATEEVETAEEHHQQHHQHHQQEQIIVAQEPDPNMLQEDVAHGEGSEIRYQIMEERIKSLQREVHMVNQSLSRVESKVDGLTRIISLFIGKFEDESELANQAAQQQQQQHEQEQEQVQEQEQEHEQEQEQDQELTTVSADGETVVPVTSLTMMSPEQQQPQHASTSTSPSSIQPKTIFLTTAAPQGTPTAQLKVQPVGVFQSSATHPAQHRSGPLAKEPRTYTHYYQFTDPATVVHVKPEGDPSPSPTPPPGHTQHLKLASNGGGGGGGNQLLDTFPDIPELPIRTVSDFLDLNDHCTDNEQFLLQMMIRLHQEVHNSQPFQRNVKRMMEALVTYDVLCQFSWSGKSAINGQYTKYVFGNSLGIIDLLTKTLNLGKSAAEAQADQKAIFAAIQSFIKHSRQNMIRDSRKRRDPMMRGSVAFTGAGGEIIAGMMPDTTTTASAITYHVANGGERFQIKQLKTERHHHQEQTEQQQQQQQQLANPF